MPHSAENNRETNALLRRKLTLLRAESLIAEGRGDEAAELCREMAAAGDSLAAVMLAGVAESLGRDQEAEDALRSALSARPDDPRLAAALGRLLLLRERSAEALPQLRAALAARPDDVEVLTGLGLALWRLNAPEEALGHYRRAEALAPLDPAAVNGMATVLMALGHHGEAEDILRRALAAVGENPELLTNLGIALRHLGRLSEAIACQRRATVLRPDDIALHWNVGVSLLTAGEFIEGWRAFDRRWTHRAESPAGEAPPWDGSPLAGRTLLLFQEQGQGDAIQFGRFAPLVAGMGGRLIAEVHAGLVPLFQASGLFAEVSAQGAPLPAHDVRLSLMSLPRLMTTTLETIPPPGWLTVDEAAVAVWRSRLPPGQGPAVGLVWAGNPIHRGDRFRSIPLERLRPVLGTGARFVSLQVGSAREQLASLPETLRPLDLGGAFTSFADTAAATASLDLVVTCDTAPAHLAASLGVSTWTLLPAAGDWRWLVERGDTPWYPSMRLYRQSRLGDWDDVIARIANDLAGRVAEGA